MTQELQDLYIYTFICSTLDSVAGNCCRTFVFFIHFQQKNFVSFRFPMYFFFKRFGSVTPSLASVDLNYLFIELTIHLK